MGGDAGREHAMVPSGRSVGASWSVRRLAELPGIRKEDVKVELTPLGLMITGERKRDQEERREGIYRSTQLWRVLSTIPDSREANLEQAKAQFEDGILKVSLPIPESKRQRREIPIETGSQEGQTTNRAA